MFYRYRIFKRRLVSMALSASIAVSMAPGMVKSVQADDSGNNESPIEATTTDSVYDDSYASSYGVCAVSSVLNGIDSNTTPGTVTNFPKFVDNSKEKYFPEIKSQEEVGSCNAWALCYYAFTYE